MCPTSAFNPEPRDRIRKHRKDRGGGKCSHHSCQPVSQPSLTHTQVNIILQCDHSCYENTYFLAEICALKCESTIRILHLCTKTNLHLQKFRMRVAPVRSNSSIKYQHQLWTALSCLVVFSSEGNICLKVLCGCCRVVDDRLQTRNRLRQPQKSLRNPEPIYHKRHSLKLTRVAEST